MLRYTILFICCCISLSAFCQDSPELAKRNGFKDIKMVMPVDSIKGIKFKKDIKEKDEFPAKLYMTEHPDYSKIGEVAVNRVELKAYKGLVYEITVIAEKDPRLMKALESIYGKANYDQLNELYFWTAANLVMKFKSHSRNQLEMVYTSHIVHKMMKEDKNKKVEDIADDF